MPNRASKRMLTVASSLALIAAFAAADASAQEAQGAAPQDSKESSRLLAGWDFGVSGYTINPPHDDAYVATVLRADYDVLHLEGRWNYEDMHTASVFAGWNLDWNRDFEFRLTPMFGVVWGDTDGVAPGALVDFKWKWFEAYNESEYVFDTHDNSNSYLYSWTELTVTPIDWLHVGVVGQRTQAYDTAHSFDGGLLLGVTFKRISATVYWFNPNDHDSYAQLSVGFHF